MEKKDENKQVEPTVEQLKTRGWDLMEIRKKIDAELNAIYQMIAVKSQPKPDVKKQCN